MATSRNFGGRRGVNMGTVIGAVVVLTIGIGIVGFLVAQNHKAAIATAQAWDIKGPPCPALTEDEFKAKHYTATKTFPYDNVTFGRMAGDASCSDIKSSGGKGFGTDKVCQFTSPAALTVAVRGATYFFLPGVGQPATVAIHHDTPKCVMASKFTLQNE